MVPTIQKPQIARTPTGQQPIRKKCPSLHSTIRPIQPHHKPSTEEAQWEPEGSRSPTAGAEGRRRRNLLSEKKKREGKERPQAGGLRRTHSARAGAGIPAENPEDRGSPRGDEQPVGTRLDPPPDPERATIGRSPPQIGDDREGERRGIGRPRNTDAAAPPRQRNPPFPLCLHRRRATAPRLIDAQFFETAVFFHKRP